MFAGIAGIHAIPVNLKSPNSNFPVNPCKHLQCILKLTYSSIELCTWRFCCSWYDKSPEMMEFRTGQLLFIIKRCLDCCHLWHHTNWHFWTTPYFFYTYIEEMFPLYLIHPLAFIYVKTRIFSNLTKLIPKEFSLCTSSKTFVRKLHFFPQP